MDENPGEARAELKIATAKRNDDINVGVNGEQTRPNNYENTRRNAAKMNANKQYLMRNKCNDNGEIYDKNHGIKTKKQPTCKQTYLAGLGTFQRLLLLLLLLLLNVVVDPPLCL